MAARSSAYAHRIKHDPAAAPPRFGSKSAFLRDEDLHARMQAIVAPDVKKEEIPTWRYQPWLTPVVGSGPLGLPTEFTKVAHLLPLAFLEVFGPGSLLENDTFRGVSADPTAWLFHFVRNMVDERMGHVTQLRVPTPFSGELDEGLAIQVREVAGKLIPLTSHVVLAAAQLTRTFHEISLDTCRSVSRWGSERAVMSIEHDQWPRVKREYVDLLAAACRAARRDIEAHRPADDDNIPYDAIAELLKTVVDEATRSEKSEVRIVHLQQLTEVAWALMVQNIAGGSYPGWTDLLLRLVLTDEQSIELNYKRPRWGTLRKLADHVRALIEPPSIRMWLRPEADATSRRNRHFYDAVARVLWEQTIQRMASPEDTGSVSGFPTAVAFVTSFDYELEMALSRTGHEFAERLRALDADTSFTVLLPVYATAADDAREGDFLWLEGRVLTAPNQAGAPNEDQFKAIRTLHDWRAVGGERPKSDYRIAPTVVRLSGCPLVNLPTTPGNALVADLQNLGITGAGDDIHFEHSITIDEYLALRQTENEWLWGHSGGRYRRDLPDHLTEAGLVDARRYWMVMGVPFKDPAVRIRLLSVLARQSSVSKSQVKPSDKAPPDFPDPVGSEAAASLEEVAQAVESLPKRRRLGSYGQKERVNGSSMTASEVEPGPKPIAAPVPLSVTHNDEPGLPRVAALRGAAINVRVDDEETILFNAIGLTVITAQCEDFTADIDEYSRWLARYGQKVTQKRGLQS